MKKLLYVIKPEQQTPEEIDRLLAKHGEIRFVSLMGVDLGGNATDEKIPVERVTGDWESFLSNGVQTDGSSVVLHGIATLNNARVDLVPDTTVNWNVDYNRYHLVDGAPVGTLRIPATLVHNKRTVDSRSVLKDAVVCVEANILDFFTKHPEVLSKLGINQPVKEIMLTAATELEFWVQTPRDKADVEKLATSQTLKEQYWKRTQGTVRTALEESLLILEAFGLEPEMGHKEVGGVTGELDSNGRFSHVMEQLEVDWRYSNALQAADNEYLVREIILDVFRSHGLEITFNAKPFPNVAGNGKHTHMGIAARLADGSTVNLFSAREGEDQFMSPLGLAALMGLLKNYHAVSPFVTASIDAFNRLQPGYEAPVCTVTSLGLDTATPSRNRSVLVGLVRDPANPLATRFELRAPNPLSNSWLVLAASYLAMLDGITTVGHMDSDTLTAALSKEPGQHDGYLEKERAYRSEEDVFEHYDQNQRKQLFGPPPATVWENLQALNPGSDKTSFLFRDKAFNQELIHSYRQAVLERWHTELISRVLPSNLDLVRLCQQADARHNHLDQQLWDRIDVLRQKLARDNTPPTSLFTRICTALEQGDYQLASDLQLEMDRDMAELRNLYNRYRRNFL